MKQSIFLFLILFSISACTGNSSKQASSTGNEASAIKEDVISTSKEVHPGKAVYNQNCLPCHQANGGGVPGMYPPLTDASWVTGDKDVLISIVIHGMKGEIEVNGEYYNTVMAGLPYLSDREIADVLSYVRKEYGNGAGEVTEEEVKAVRAKK